jgi:LmbE family N-acetylglucosaminyl deacetylase
MLKVTPESRPGEPLRLLCIGAHSDDLEIGCAGTVLTWLGAHPAVEITWVVLSAGAERGEEARRSAKRLLKGAARSRFMLGEFRDGFFPAQYAEVKEFFERLKSNADPDVILTHHLRDRHQDHRLAAELTWNTWRDHLILEYEIPKFEGDLGQPNTYVPVSARMARRKIMHLEQHFASQRSRSWFREENFLALMRVRGVECRSGSGFAEAFHAQKMVLLP